MIPDAAEGAAAEVGTFNTPLLLVAGAGNKTSARPLIFGIVSSAAISSSSSSSSSNSLCTTSRDLHLTSKTKVTTRESCYDEACYPQLEQL